MEVYSIFNTNLLSRLKTDPIFIKYKDESLRDTSMELTYGINVFFSRNDNLKLQLSYSFINNTFTQGAPNMDLKVLRIQFQAIF